jgi:hypothetical protein
VKAQHTGVCYANAELENLLSLDRATICAQIALVLKDSTKYQVFSCRGPDAQVLMNLLQAVCPSVRNSSWRISLIHLSCQCLDQSDLDDRLKPTFLCALLRIAKKSGCYPECLVLKDIKLDSKELMASGHFGDVWKEEIQGQMMAVKAVRMHVKSDLDKLAKVWLYFSVRSTFIICLWKLISTSRNFPMKQ